MNLDIQKIESILCTNLCAEVRVRKKSESLLQIETPFFFSDGDPYQIYIQERPGGLIRLSDMGHTLMHLSYDNDIDKFRAGTRGKILELIKAETQLDEEDGAFFIEAPIDKLGLSIFRLGQGLTKINDLTFLNRARAESTFYEDFQEQLFRIAGEEKVTKDYFYPDIESPKDYPIDYKMDGKNGPLFLFGIPNRDKARLTTIIIERLLRANAEFDSLLIFADQGSIPKGDMSRLMNAGGEMIASLDAEADFTRKLLRKLVA
jgi:hypothetical protein